MAVVDGSRLKRFARLVLVILVPYIYDILNVVCSMNDLARKFHSRYKYHGGSREPSVKLLEEIPLLYPHHPSPNISPNDGQPRQSSC